MTIDEAARTLDERLRGFPWYTAVGVGAHNGAPALFLYVKSVRRAELEFVAPVQTEGRVVGCHHLVAAPRRRRHPRK